MSKALLSTESSHKKQLPTNQIARIYLKIALHKHKHGLYSNREIHSCSKASISSDRGEK